MLVIVDGVGAVTPVETGLLVLAVLFLAAVAGAEVIRRHGQPSGRWRRQASTPELEGRSVRGQLWAKSCIAVGFVGAVVSASLALSRPEVLVVPFLFLPALVLFIVGCSVTNRLAGRVLCLLALCIAVPVPLVWHGQFSEPLTTVGQFMLGAIAISLLLGLEDRRRQARDAEWKSLSDRIRHSRLGDDGMPAASLRLGPCRRTRANPDRIEQAERLKAGKSLYQLPRIG